MTNAQMAAQHSLFRAACEIAGVKPTKRQAARWQQKRGRAWAKREQAQAQLKQSKPTRTNTSGGAD